MRDHVLHVLLFVVASLLSSIAPSRAEVPPSDDGAEAASISGESTPAGASEGKAAAGDEGQSDAGGEVAAAEKAEEPVAESGPCARAVALDDGGIETGYGFVPSAEWGLYLQRFDLPALRGVELEAVCVCFMKTRGDTDADFELVFYAEEDRRLPPQPYAVVAGSVDDLADDKKLAGRFDAIPVDGVRFSEKGPTWIGVRWDPSVENFFFVCADQSRSEEEAGREAIPVVLQEDRRPQWADVIGNRDPIFTGHHAIGVRPVPKPKPKPESEPKPESAEEGASEAADAAGDSDG